MLDIERTLFTFIFLKENTSFSMGMFTKRTTAALFTIALASSLIVAGGFAGFAFAATKGKGNSVANTMTNSDDSGGDSNNNNNNNNPAASSDSQTPNDPTGSIGKTNNLLSEMQSSLHKCLNGDGSGASLNLAKIKSCVGQLTSGGAGQGTEDQSSPAQGIGLPNLG
jgi:hypothetical protein